MTTITPKLRDNLIHQQGEMLADEHALCPFDDQVLAREWWRADDLDLDDAVELRRELLETERLLALGASTSSTTAVSVDELLERGYTRRQLKQLDDDGLLAVVWDRPETRRNGYVLRVELDALPGRLQAHAEEQARQRQLRSDYVAGRRSKPLDDEADDLPDWLK